VNEADFSIDNETIKAHPHSRKNGEDFRLDVRRFSVSIPGQPEKNWIDNKRYPWEGDAKNKREGIP